MRPPFSRRLQWRAPENALARAVEARRASGRELLDLTESNPTRAIGYPPSLVEALADPRALAYAPSPRGLDEARAAVAGYYASRGLAVAAERVWLTASTSEAYAFLFKVLADPGDALLAPQPSYPLFDYLAALESVSLQPYRLRYDGAWWLDADDLRRAVTPEARALLVVHPNNPTGSFIKCTEREALVALAVERGLALIVDEVFGDYAFADDGARTPSFVDEERALTFVLSGLSKVAGLPQLKLGWIVVAGPDDLRAEAEARLELVADTYLSVGAPVQHAAAKLLAAGAEVRQTVRQRTLANCKSLARAVAGSAAELLAVEGGWYATLRVPRVRTEEEWALALVDEGVLVQPGYFFDFEEEAYLVVSLLTEPEILNEGVSCILREVGKVK